MKYYYYFSNILSSSITSYTYYFWAIRVFYICIFLFWLLATFLKGYISTRDNFVLLRLKLTVKVQKKKLKFLKLQLLCSSIQMINLDDIFLIFLLILFTVDVFLLNGNNSYKIPIKLGTWVKIDFDVKIICQTALNITMMLF